MTRPGDPGQAAPTDSWGRSHHTTVAIVPPESAWSPIQAVRRRHDRQVRRWPPHLNLLYPFVLPENVEAALPALRAAAATVPRFSLTLSDVRWFQHGRKRATVWLAPVPDAPLRLLQSVLQAAFPGHDDQQRFPHGFTPHLSVGQARGARARAALVAEARAAALPLYFEVRDVAVLRRGPDTPFAIVARCPLGGSVT